MVRIVNMAKKIKTKAQQCHLEELLLEILLVEFSEFPAKQVSAHCKAHQLLLCIVYIVRIPYPPLYFTPPPPPLLDNQSSRMKAQEALCMVNNTKQQTKTWSFESIWNLRQRLQKSGKKIRPRRSTSHCMSTTSCEKITELHFFLKLSTSPPAWLGGNNNFLFSSK